MRWKADEIYRMFLWLLLTGGLVSLFIYGLSFFLVKPTIETITTRAPGANGSDMRRVDYKNRKPN